MPADIPRDERVISNGATIVRSAAIIGRGSILVSFFWISQPVISSSNLLVERISNPTSEPQYGQDGFSKVAALKPPAV